MLVITKALYRSFTVTLDQYSSGSPSVQSMSEMIVTIMITMIVIIVVIIDDDGNCK